jgi:hypothetical protein
MLQNLIDMSDVQVSETIRVATDADMEAIRRLVNQAFEVERFLKRGGGESPAGRW